MAKLDEFGRQIYETAEEYNKAHKGGVCPRTYDSPDGSNYQHNTTNGAKRYQSMAQRQATQTASQNAKKIILAIAVFIIALHVGIIVTMITMTTGSFGEIYQEFEEDFRDYEDVIVDYDESTPLPEEFDEFYYNGVDYSLPTDYEQIEKMGFFTEGYSGSDLIMPDYEEMLGLSDADGYLSAWVRINNDNDVEIPIGKCMVDYFQIYNLAAHYSYEETPDFSFGDGLTFDSSYDDVEFYFGVPYDYYEIESDDGECYEYYQWIYYQTADEDSDELDEVHYVQICFFNDVMESVTIEKKKVEDKYE